MDQKTIVHKIRNYFKCLQANSLREDKNIFLDGIYYGKIITYQENCSWARSRNIIYYLDMYIDNLDDFLKLDFDKIKF